MLERATLKQLIETMPPTILLSQEEYDRILPLIHENNNSNNEVCGLLRGVFIISEGIIIITQIITPQSHEIKTQSSTYCELDHEFLIRHLTTVSAIRKDDFLGRWHTHFGLQSLSATDLAGVRSFMNKTSLPTHDLHLELLFVNSLHDDSRISLRAFLFLRSEDDTPIELPCLDPIILPTTLFHKFLPWYMQSSQMDDFITQLKSNQLTSTLKQTKLKYGSMFLHFENNLGSIQLILPAYFTPAQIHVEHKWEPSYLAFLKAQLTGALSLSKSVSIEVKTKNFHLKEKGVIRTTKKHLIITMPSFKKKIPLKTIRIKSLTSSSLTLQAKYSWFKTIFLILSFQK